MRKIIATALALGGGYLIVTSFGLDTSAYSQDELILEFARLAMGFVMIFIGIALVLSGSAYTVCHTVYTVANDAKNASQHGTENYVEQVQIDNHTKPTDPHPNGEKVHTTDWHTHEQRSDIANQQKYGDLYRQDPNAVIIDGEDPVDFGKYGLDHTPQSYDS